MSGDVILMHRGATVHLGWRRHVYLKVVSSRAAITIRDDNFGRAREIALADLVRDLSLDSLHKLVEPAMRNAIAKAEKHERKLGQAQRRRIKERDRLRCHYCHQAGDWYRGPDRTFWHIDHKVPMATGGTDDDDNLVLACASCNIRKGAKSLEQFQAETVS